jgi:NAD+ synthase (glutamine-hydrolysing)
MVPQRELSNSSAAEAGEGRAAGRGDWRAPSDSSAKAWLDDLERNVPPA